MRLIRLRKWAGRSFCLSKIDCMEDAYICINSLTEAFLPATGKEIMSIFELFLIAVGLSMDAFAVAICKGLSMKKMSWKNALKAGVYFGGFQALMPFAGYMLGVNFKDLITKVDHWIAFILLSIIGISMIKEAFGKEEDVDDDFGVKTMITLAIATSIDALAIGVTFAFLNVNIVPAISFIGCITFIFGVVGVRIGNVFGTKYKAKAEILGGIILIAMGIKILFEHLGILSF